MSVQPSPAAASLATHPAQPQPTLFSPYTLGDIPLNNRLVLSPMTRSRALDGNVANPLAATYYVQRASAGLMITEGTQVSPQGVGYIRTPGIHSPEQVAGWKHITDAVHRVGGTIFAQLWHVGRVSHPDFHGGALAGRRRRRCRSRAKPSPSTARSRSRPRARSRRSEIRGIIEQFRKGAENAKAAGFDGVELHGANGYLLDQFLRDGANRRTDAYGGSISKRARLPLEVAEAVAGVFGANRVGYKLSPYFPGYSMSDSNPIATFTYIAKELGKLGLGYLHVSEAIAGPMKVDGTVRVTPFIREVFDGTLMVNGGYDAATADAAIARGEADLVAFGVPFIANPDLPLRYRKRAALNTPDAATFYAGEEKGYTDYPALTH